jgi:hypothetical protein
MSVTHTQVSYISSFRGYGSWVWHTHSCVTLAALGDMDHECDTHMRTHTQVSYISSFRGYRSWVWHTHTHTPRAHTHRWVTLPASGDIGHECDTHTHTHTQPQVSYITSFRGCISWVWHTQMDVQEVGQLMVWNRGQEELVHNYAHPL